MKRHWSGCSESRLSCRERSPGTMTPSTTARRWGASWEPEAGPGERRLPATGLKSRHPARSCPGFTTSKPRSGGLGSIATGKAGLKLQGPGWLGKEMLVWSRARKVQQLCELGADFHGCWGFSFSWVWLWHLNPGAILWPSYMCLFTESSPAKPLSYLACLHHLSSVGNSTQWIELSAQWGSSILWLKQRIDEGRSIWPHQPFLKTFNILRRCLKNPSVSLLIFESNLMLTFC